MMPICAVPPLGFLNLGMPEILLIFFIVLLLFGAKRLPDLARGLGKSVREFKKAASEAESDIREAIDEKPKVKPAAPPAPPESSKN